MLVSAVAASDTDFATVIGHGHGRGHGRGRGHRIGNGNGIDSGTDADAERCRALHCTIAEARCPFAMLAGHSKRWRIGTTGTFFEVMIDFSCNVVLGFHVMKI
jgi:hypothetical protein